MSADQPQVYRDFYTVRADVPSAHGADGNPPGDVPDLRDALAAAHRGEAATADRLASIQALAAELVRNGGDLNWQTKRVTVKLSDLLALADALGIRVGEAEPPAPRPYAETNYRDD